MLSIHPKTWKRWGMILKPNKSFSPIRIPSVWDEKFADRGGEWGKKTHQRRNAPCYRIKCRDDTVLLTTIRGMSVSTSVIDDKVLLKADGMPTYHLARGSGDHLMKSRMVPGEEWLQALRHVLYGNTFAWKYAEWAHLLWFWDKWEWVNGMAPNTLPCFAWTGRPKTNDSRKL